MTYARLLLALAVLALTAAPAVAQTAYKSTMPDGRVIYGDKPAPGARKVERVSVAAPRSGQGGASDGARSEQGTSSEQIRLKQQEEAWRARSAEREQNHQLVRDAEEALKAAEDARRNGEEPMPGERLGTAGGGSRLSEEYFERQRQLEKGVEEARQALDDARRAAR